MIFVLDYYALTFFLYLFSLECIEILGFVVLSYHQTFALLDLAVFSNYTHGCQFSVTLRFLSLV